LNVNIFQSYLVSGDWIVLISADCSLAPYYLDKQDPGAFVAMELVNNAGVVVASTPMKYWDRQPIAIYLNAASAAAQTWAGVYVIRLTDVSGSPYNLYSVAATDWKGSNQLYIDKWIIAQAIDYEIYYSGTALLVDTADKGKVLNDTGKVMFARGIPQITTVRPLMFQTSTGTDTNIPAIVYTRAYETGRDYHTELGIPLSNILEDITLITTGNVTTNNVKDVGTFIIVSVYLILAIAATSYVSAWAGIALGVPLLLVGGYFGIVNLTAVAIVGTIMGFIFIYQWIWSKG
jgi:hypothetical protein